MNNVDKNQNQEDKQKEIEELKRFISTAEESLESAKKALFKLTGESIRPGKPTFKPESDQLESLNVGEGGKIIEGIFDGENMVGPEEKVYPIPANYASKSKLVEGDKLKLTIADDGSFIFKQIGPIKRKKIIGTLSFDDNAYHVLAEGKTYNILYASVTYYKARPGDKVTIIVPQNKDANWAALENVIHDVKDKKKQYKEDEIQINSKTVSDKDYKVDDMKIDDISKDASSTEKPQTKTSMPEGSFLQQKRDENKNDLEEKKIDEISQNQKKTNELEI